MFMVPSAIHDPLVQLPPQHLMNTILEILVVAAIETINVVVVQPTDAVVDPVLIAEGVVLAETVEHRPATRLSSVPADVGRGNNVEGGGGGRAGLSRVE